MFCLHGGLSPSLDTLDNIRSLDRIQEVHCILPFELVPNMDHFMHEVCWFELLHRQGKHFLEGQCSSRTEQCVDSESLFRRPKSILGLEQRKSCAAPLFCHGISFILHMCIGTPGILQKHLSDMVNFSSMYSKYPRAEVYYIGSFV